MPKSFAVEMLANGEWCGNQLRFPTKDEADAYAWNIFMRWTTPTDKRSVESEDEPTHTFHAGRLEPYSGKEVCDAEQRTETA